MSYVEAQITSPSLHLSIFERKLLHGRTRVAAGWAPPTLLMVEEGYLIET